MLTALTQGFHFRFAVAFAAFAALCFVVPPAVLANGHGAHAIDCLAHADMINHGMSKAAGVAHHGDHSTPSSTHQPGSGCCGLFCMSALPAELDQGLRNVAVEQALALPPQPSALTRAPEKPDRPPISLPVS
jgi:hypothetical protein